MFDKAMEFDEEGIQRVTSKVAFMAGSSQHGKARRASVDSNCVTAIIFFEPSSAGKLRILVV